MATVPPKLAPGARLRVVAPSRSIAMLSDEVRAVADRRLAALGFTVRFGEHVRTCDAFASSSVDERLGDLHDAFADPEVDGILPVIGGFNSNQLLARLDDALIRDHPKVLSGYSDITALSNALWARAGLVTYSGPHYSTFGMMKHFEDTEAGFRACVMSDDAFELTPSSHWSDDPWYADQEHRVLEPNPGWWVLQPGEAAGTIVGGNLCTFNLLQGTPSMPSLEETIVFAEDDHEVRPWHFDRDLVSLLQQPGADGIAGLVIGRFQRDTGMTRQLLDQIVATKPELAGKPVIANVDIGHTSPVLTFPVGGRVEVRADPDDPHITITEH
jgi:muramoyltetrapeptide carboxypeptidase LdcA involved in peptidoglycan recycling